ncbi:MAG: ankyrin repeat protein, partial [Rickettsiales bacterium]
KIDVNSPINQYLKYWKDLASKDGGELIDIFRSSKPEIIKQAQETLQNIIKEYLPGLEYEQYAELLGNGEGGFLFHDIMRKIGSNSPEIPNLMINITSYFDQIAKLKNKENQRNILAQFPMPNKNEYHCDGGLQSRLTLAAMQMKGSFSEIIKNRISGEAQKLSHFADQGNEPHITSMLEVILGFEQADNIWHMPVNQIPAELVWKFVSNFYGELKNQCQCAHDIQKNDILEIAEIFNGIDRWVDFKIAIRPYLSKLGFSDKYADDLMNYFFLQPVYDEQGKIDDHIVSLNEERVKEKLKELVSDLVLPMEDLGEIPNFNLSSKSCSDQIIKILKNSDSTSHQRQLAVTALWIMSSGFAGTPTYGLSATIERIKQEFGQDLKQSLRENGFDEGLISLVEKYVQKNDILIYKVHEYIYQKKSVFEEYGLSSQEIEMRERSILNIQLGIFPKLLIECDKSQESFLVLFDELLKHEDVRYEIVENWAELIFYHSARDMILSLIQNNQEALYQTNGQRQKIEVLTPDNIIGSVWNQLFAVSVQKQDIVFLENLRKYELGMNKIGYSTKFYMLNVAINTENKQMMQMGLELLGGLEGLNKKYGSEEKTILFFAAEEENLSMIKYLLGQGVGVNLPDKNGITPLMIAIKNDRIDAVQILIDVGLKNENGVEIIRELLPFAMKNGSIKMIDLMMEKGKIGINDPCDEHKKTPIMIAVENKAPKAAAHFIDKGADIGAINQNGETALHIATRNIKNAFTLLLPRLIRKDILDICDNYGNTPLHNFIALKHKSSFLGAKNFITDKNYNLENTEGETPFVIALRNHNLKFAREVFDIFNPAEQVDALNKILIRDDKTLTNGALRFIDSEHFPGTITSSPRAEPLQEAVEESLAEESVSTEDHDQADDSPVIQQFSTQAISALPQERPEVFNFSNIMIKVATSYEKNPEHKILLRRIEQLQIPILTTRS